MKILKYRGRFLTPAFLGDADQSGQWRTPPFKALLRQWWRVVKARECDYDHSQLREAEGCLFGHAWLKDQSGKQWAMQSRIRLRLAEWRGGRMQQWQNDPPVFHKEVGINGRKIGSHLYLGYGPLTYKKHKGTSLKETPAIDANEALGFSLGVSAQNESDIQETLQLIHWFGTLGGRSRNGWGSVCIESLNEQNGFNLTPMDSILSGKAIQELLKFSRPLADCLQLDWPHAIGTSDERLLLWKSRFHFDSWSQAMQELARIKIAFRTACSIRRNQDKEENGKCNPCLDDRHILAYPVTHHGVNGWVEKDKKSNFRRDKRGYLIQSERLANQLRFKIVQNKNNRYWCLAFHLPCGLPEMLQEKLGLSRISHADQFRVWNKVHGILDKEMKRIQGTQEGRP